MRNELSKCKNSLLLFSIAIAIGICTYRQGYLTKAIEWMESYGLRGLLFIAFVGIVSSIAYGFYIYNKVHRSWCVTVAASCASVLCVYCIGFHKKEDSLQLWMLLLISLIFLFIDLCTVKSPQHDTRTLGEPQILMHDTPTFEIEERRKTVATTIVKAIRNDISRNDNILGSYVINIDGVYGSGKSSLLKYIKYGLLDKEDVVIDFSPWRYPSKEKLIENFFLILSSALVKYFSSNIKDLFSRYVSAIIKDYGAYSGITNIVDELAHTSHDSNKLYSEIREKLSLLRKPIYIFLDDLDRLKSNEIWTVCYLIRDMTNFPYLYFIVASDMEYVELMLGKELPSKQETNIYLKKIINLNIPLPHTNVTNVYRQLEYGIVVALSEVGIETKDIDKTLGNIRESSTTKYIKKAFPDYREVKRFLSSLRFSLHSYPTKEFKENINIQDFIWLEIIKFKCPFMYKQLCADCLQLLTVSKDRYTLRSAVKDYTNKKNQKVFEDFIAQQETNINGEIYKKR